MPGTPGKSDLTPNQLHDMVMRVTTACLSGDAEICLKGSIARELLDKIVAFQYKVLDPRTDQEVGEIDVETSTHIIEVTDQGDGFLQKISKLKNDPLLNPRRKKVVLYAPHCTPAAAREVVEESIPVIQSLERLLEYLKK